MQVHAEDPDIDRRSNIRYSLTGQFADQGYFTINEVTGDIYVTKRLDRDKPGGRAVWNFNVLAHDEPGSGQSLTGYAIVQVKPKDINDNAPEFDSNRLVGRVLEHSRAGRHLEHKWQITCHLPVGVVLCRSCAKIQYYKLVTNELKINDTVLVYIKRTLVGINDFEYLVLHFMDCAGCMQC